MTNDVHANQSDGPQPKVIKDTKYAVHVCVYEVSRHYEEGSDSEDFTNQNNDVEFDLMDEYELIGPLMYDTYEEARQKAKLASIGVDKESDAALEAARDYIEQQYQGLLVMTSRDAQLQVGLERVLQILNQKG